MNTKLSRTQFLEQYFSPDEEFYIFFLENNPKDGEKPKHREYCNNIWKSKYHFQTHENWNKNYGASMHFSVNSFKADTDGNLFRSKKYVSKIKSLFFDCDDIPDDAEYGDKVKDKIIKELGQPTWLIQSSPHKWQLLYSLTGETFSTPNHEKLSKTLIRHFGSDKVTFDVSRYARLPDTINHKNGFRTKVTKTGGTYEYSHFVKYIGENNVSLVEDQPARPKKKKYRESIDHSSLVIKPTRQYQEKWREFNSKATSPSDADCSFLIYLIKVKGISGERTLYKHFISNPDNILQRHPDIDRYFDITLTAVRSPKYLG